MNFFYFIVLYILFESVVTGKQVHCQEAPVTPSNFSLHVGRYCCSYARTNGSCASFLYVVL